MNKEVNSRINITDADISNFYNAKRPFNFIEPKYNIAEIVVTPRLPRCNRGPICRTARRAATRRRAKRSR